MDTIFMIFRIIFYYALLFFLIMGVLFRIVRFIYDYVQIRFSKNDVEKVHMTYSFWKKLYDLNPKNYYYGKITIYGLQNDSTKKLYFIKEKGQSKSTSYLTSQDVILINFSIFFYMRFQFDKFVKRRKLKKQKEKEISEQAMKSILLKSQKDIDSLLAKAQKEINHAEEITNKVKRSNV